MAERLEFWGHPCSLPPDPDPEPIECRVCGESVDEDDLHRCGQCGSRGCPKCMIHDDDYGEWFCGTEGDSGCRDAYIEKPV